MLVNFRVQIRLGSIYLIDGGIAENFIPFGGKRYYQPDIVFSWRIPQPVSPGRDKRAEDNIHALQFTSIQNVLDGRSIVMGVV